MRTSASLVGELLKDVQGCFRDSWTWLSDSLQSVVYLTSSFQRFSSILLSHFEYISENLFRSFRGYLWDILDYLKRGWEILAVLSLELTYPLRATLPIPNNSFWLLWNVPSLFQPCSGFFEALQRFLRGFLANYQPVDCGCRTSVASILAGC